MNLSTFPQIAIVWLDSCPDLAVVGKVFSDVRFLEVDYSKWVAFFFLWVLRFVSFLLLWVRSCDFST